MKVSATAALLLVVALQANAQRLSHPVMASRDDASLAPRQTLAIPETLRVLAAMAQFQEDRDAGTTGDGRFDLSSAPDSTIDAPPRDASYFRDHLTFLANYYRKASRGKLIVRATLIDSVITLPAVMRRYSPAKGGDNTPVADLARDTWRALDSTGKFQDFSSYDCFVVFHAGAGRDIDLVSILGYDPAPFDIPSLYLGLNAFRGAYGGSYQGIPVQNGSYFITNSVVLPETEGRKIPSVGGNAYLELGINGILVASVGNYLGLPDLFDTNTGVSGIGRFGLMDGAAIFSFAGVFPPQPSAWEKYWLGWLEPITLPSGTTALTLPAQGIEAASATRLDTVYRVPISGTEYYLVENRNRDPERNGQRVTSTFRGTPRIQTFPRDTAGFNAFDIESLSGVITDVEDLDWSLPGGVDEDGTFYDGGILLWHIDEAVIRGSIGSNAVNADPARRGVSVLEADGSQDIGQSYGSFTPGSGSEQGTALDFWYSGNPSPVNKNIFNATSFPPSRTNSGALSHVTVRDFSLRGPRMTATVIRGDSAISPVPGFPKLTGEYLSQTTVAPGLTVGDADADGIPDLLLATAGQPLVRQTTGGEVWSPRTRSSLFQFPGDGSAPKPGLRGDGIVALSGSEASVLVSPPALWESAPAPLVIIGEQGTGASSTRLMRALVLSDQDGDSLADGYFSTEAAGRVDLPPVVGDSLAAFGGSDGRVKFVRANGTVADSLAAGTGEAKVSLWKEPNAFVITTSDGQVIITARLPGGGVSSPDRRLQTGRTNLSYAATGLFAGGVVHTAFVADGEVYLVDKDLNAVPGFPRSGIGAVSSPALADVDGDGSRDIVVFGSRTVWALNVTGAPVDRFPVAIQLAEGDSIASSPVIADVDGDNIPDIIGVSRNGYVFAYDRNGSMVRGFPLQAGVGPQGVAVYGIAAGVPPRPAIALAVASGGDGSVSAFITGVPAGPLASGARPWPQWQRDARHGGLALEPLSGTPFSSEFFPAGRVYNWPNPVYARTTYIRFYLNSDANVEISIFDLAGDLVHRTETTGRGGMDNEVPWDVSGVQSGVYFARVKATGSSSEASTVIKIAVVR